LNNLYDFNLHHIVGKLVDNLFTTL
jgi:hypothetical protein